MVDTHKHGHWDTKSGGCDISKIKITGGVGEKAFFWGGGQFRLLSVGECGGGSKVVTIEGPHIRECMHTLLSVQITVYLSLAL